MPSNAITSWRPSDKCETETRLKVQNQSCSNPGAEGPSASSPSSLTPSVTTNKNSLPVSRYSLPPGRSSPSRSPLSDGVRQELSHSSNRVQLSKNIWLYICLGGVKFELHPADPCSCTVTQGQGEASMALSETVFDSSTADLINLRKILEACLHVPEVGDVSSGQPLTGTAREQRFCLALDRFESTTKVFETPYYESEVLHIGCPEEELDDRLRKEARDVGVPESHFPVAKRRRIHNRLSKHASLLQQQSVAMADSQSMQESSTSTGAPLNPASVRASVASRPSLSAPSSDRQLARQSMLSTHTSNTTHEPTPATSVISFKSTSSQSSGISNLIFGKRRDSRHSIKQFFRRESSSRKNSIAGQVASPTVEATVSLQHNAIPSHTIEEEPDVASPHSHQSQDLSSIQSLTISSRTSMSSFGDPQQPDQDISGVAKRGIERFVQSLPFLKMRAACEDEIHRFNSFVLDQHIALPLILGRNHLYNQDRIKIRLADMQKQHESEIEHMDDRFASKELELQEIQRVVMEDYKARNATAVKHVASRIALLGQDATAEHHHRLEEEQSALKRLAEKHDKEMQSLVRYQDSKKLDLLRKQEKDYKESNKSLEAALMSQRKDKTTKLHHNLARLEELVEERRARLVARFFLKLQILKCMSNDTVMIEPALPLSLLRLPIAFTSGLGYS